MLKRVPLIHDDSLSSRAVMPTWADWFAAAGVRDADVSRGLRFNSADHALDATVEGAGVLLALDALAYDDLRTGRLVMPFDLTLPSGRCYSFVCPKKRRELRECAGLPRVAQGRGGRPRLEQARDARSRFAARGAIVRGAASLALILGLLQFSSSASIGIGMTPTPSSIRALASSRLALPRIARSGSSP